MKYQRSLTDSINKGGGDDTHTAIYIYISNTAFY